MLVNSFGQANFTLVVDLMNYSLSKDVGRTAIITPWKPFFFDLDLQDDDAVFVDLESSDSVLLGVSVQDNNCPVYDLPSNIDFTGIYQTMTKTTRIHVSRSKFGQHALLVLVLVPPSDIDYCTLPKQVVIEVKTAMEPSEYVAPVLIAVGG